MNRITIIALLFIFISCNVQAQKARIWMKYEIRFQSDKTYGNALYEVSYFRLTFTSPTGKNHGVNGFWDGGKEWKVRFCPDERGTWKWKSDCSDSENTGLHNREGNFECVLNDSNEEIYRRGPVIHPKGKYYLTYSDGNPFFWLACTAWNGALKSTNEFFQPLIMLLSPCTLMAVHTLVICMQERNGMI